MQLYPSNFQSSTILPKMHILEMHVVPWLRKWHIGFGFYGEQGIGSIYHCFNSLTRTYSGGRDPEQRLLYMLKEHALHVAPINIAVQTKPRKTRQSVKLCMV